MKRISKAEREPPGERSYVRQAEMARFLVGVIGVSPAAWFFLRTENMVRADLYLVGFLLVGEIGGRAAAYGIEKRGKARWERRE